MRKRVPRIMEATRKPPVMRNGCLIQILLVYLSYGLLKIAPTTQAARWHLPLCQCAAFYHELLCQASIHPDGEWTWHHCCHEAVQSPRDMGRAIGRESGQPLGNTL